MVAIYNLPSTTDISPGDQVLMFVLSAGTTFKVSVNDLSSFIIDNYPSAVINAALAGLPRQVTVNVPPVPTGQAYITLDGFVVVAQ